MPVERPIEIGEVVVVSLNHYGHQVERAAVYLGYDHTMSTYLLWMRVIVGEEDNPQLVRMGGNAVGLQVIEQKVIARPTGNRDAPFAFLFRAAKRWWWPFGREQFYLRTDMKWCWDTDSAGSEGLTWRPLSDAPLRVQRAVSAVIAAMRNSDIVFGLLGRN